MLRIASLKYLVALVALLALAAGTVAYAAQEKRFNLPVMATVTLKVQSAAEVADLNVDGAVDARDLLIVTLNINTSPPSDPRADVDKNGAVDIRDLAFVALHFSP